MKEKRNTKKEYKELKNPEIEKLKLWVGVQWNMKFWDTFWWHIQRHSYNTVHEASPKDSSDIFVDTPKTSIRHIPEIHISETHPEDTLPRHSSPRHSTSRYWNSELVSSGVSLSACGQGTLLALQCNFLKQFNHFKLSLRLKNTGLFSSKVSARGSPLPHEVSLSP